MDEGEPQHLPTLLPSKTRDQLGPKTQVRDRVSYDRLPLPARPHP
jgi:hypothetical protein